MPGEERISKLMYKNNEALFDRENGVNDWE